MVLLAVPTCCFQTYFPHVLNLPLIPGCILSETAPRPIFRTRAQTPLYRIAVKVTDLFDKLPGVADVEIIALLPEVLGISDQPPRLLSVSASSRHRPAFRFAAH